MQLKILTLTWQGIDKLENLYNSIQKTKVLDGINYKWFIKDNGSTDGTVEKVKSWNNPNIEIFAYPDNLQNFSQGMNYLFDKSNAQPEDIILLLNNDVEFNDKDSIYKMLSLIKKHDVGVVGAKLFYKGTTNLQHAGVVFNKNVGLPYHFRSKEKDDKFSSKNRYFQAVTGAVLMTKASIYKETNGLDEKLNWCFDDIDFCLHVKYKLNKKIVYCGETNISHEESASLKKNPINKLFMNKNANYFKLKWHTYFKLDQLDYEKNKNYNIL